MNSAFQPKISVIVPMYNVEKYIAYALRSLQSQTYKNLEIIVVNDGSPDHSLEIAESFAKKDTRIKVISRKNGGLSAARNTGIQNATGRYVNFLDADDFLHPYFFEFLIRKIQEEPNLDMVSVRAEIVTDHEFSGKFKSSSLIEMKGKFLSPEDCYRQAIIDKFGHISARIIKKQYWDKVKFQEGIIYEDVEVMPRLYQEFQYGGFSYKESLFFYFKNPNGISKKRNLKAKYSRFLSFVRNENIAKVKFAEDFRHCHNRTIRDVKSILRWRLYYKQLTLRQRQTVQLYVKEHKAEFSFLYRFLSLFL